MPYSDTLFLNLMARVENGFGRLEEGQKLNRLASEQRAQNLERQISEHRQETRAELKEIRSKMERVKQQATSDSSTRWLEIAGLLVKPLTFLASHWQAIAWVMLTVLGFFGVQSPETIKALLGK